MVSAADTCTQACTIKARNLFSQDYNAADPVGARINSLKKVGFTGLKEGRPRKLVK
jgi:hypothetical protein